MLVAFVSSQATNARHRALSFSENSFSTTISHAAREDGHERIPRSIKEIAAIQGITEAGIKKRLHVAGEHLEKALNGDEGDSETKAGAFWGFGSFEELLDALSEERERQWRDIESAIREIEPPPDFPSSSAPPAPAPPMLPVPTVIPRLAAASKAVWTAVAAGAPLGGAYLAVRASTAHEPTPVAAIPEPPATSVQVSPSSALPSSRAHPPALTAAARTAASSPPVRPAKRPVRSPAATDDLDGRLQRALEDGAP